MIIGILSIILLIFLGLLIYVVSVKPNGKTQAEPQPVNNQAEAERKKTTREKIALLFGKNYVKVIILSILGLTILHGIIPEFFNEYLWKFSIISLVGIYILASYWEMPKEGEKKDKKKSLTAKIAGWVKFLCIIAIAGEILQTSGILDRNGREKIDVKEIRNIAEGKIREFSAEGKIPVEFENTSWSKEYFISKQVTDRGPAIRLTLKGADTAKVRVGRARVLSGEINHYTEYDFSYTGGKSFNLPVIDGYYAKSLSFLGKDQLKNIVYVSFLFQ